MNSGETVTVRKALSSQNKPDYAPILVQVRKMQGNDTDAIQHIFKSLSNDGWGFFYVQRRKNESHQNDSDESNLG